MGRKLGPPSQHAAYRVPGRGLRPLLAADTEPVVSTLGRAAELLGCDPVALANAVTVLEPWGRHASGAPVWRWPELCQAAAAVGLEVPPTRPTLAAWRDHQTRRTTAKARAAKVKAASS